MSLPSVSFVLPNVKSTADAEEFLKNFQAFFERFTFERVDIFMASSVSLHDVEIRSSRFSLHKKMFSSSRLPGEGLRWGFSQSQTSFVAVMDSALTVPFADFIKAFMMINEPSAPAVVWGHRFLPKSKIYGDHPKKSWSEKKINDRYLELGLDPLSQFFVADRVRTSEGISQTTLRSSTVYAEFVENLWSHKVPLAPLAIHSFERKSSFLWRTLVPQIRWIEETRRFLQARKSGT